MTGPSPDQLLLQRVPEVMLLSSDPHHQLLSQVLQEINTSRPYMASLPTYSAYPFPCILLLEPPPVWMPMPPALIGYHGGETRPPSTQRTATAVSSYESHHQPLASLPANPAHQYLRNLTEALSKARTLETLRTHPTLHTLPNNGGMSCPPVRAMVNRERCTSHSPSLHTSPPSDTQSPQLLELEDILEEDIAEPPRGHHPPPIMPGTLSPNDKLNIDPQPDDS